MEDLVRGVAARLGRSVRLASRVAMLDTRAGGGYTLGVHGLGRLDADAVVLAGPAVEAAALMAPLDREISRELRGIASAPLAVVCLGYDAAAIAAARGPDRLAGAVPLDGFGFLVPRGQGPRILGALWESSIYPGRAPEGHALIRVMIGGARDPDAVLLDDDALLSTVKSDLRQTMGLGATPAFVRIYRHRVGIPQYIRGHLARLARIDARLARLPGLYLAGNSYHGVAINSCVAEAGPLAARVLSDLDRRLQAWPEYRKTDCGVAG
jgi:oxygen-dependent protoporphyrinogen oxidase